MSSLDPAALDEDFFALVEGEPRLLPHVHLSLQSGCDLILKRMKRRHSVAAAAAAIARLRRLRPGIALGADLIAGFPTETDALFGETLAFLRDQALPYLHVFPYSERPGTPAARMPAVPVVVRRERGARLREVGEAAAGAFHASHVGAEIDVLTETDMSGHTAHFAPVRFSRALPEATLLRARVTGADVRGLWADAA